MKVVILLIVGLGITTGGSGELLVDHVPAAVLSGPAARLITVTATGIVAVPAATGRWEKFEAEFGIQQPSRSLVKGSLQTAKYQLDRTALALQEFVDTVTDRLRFDYGLSDLGLASRSHGATGNLLTDALSRMRLQSDIDVKLGEKAFVGVKLVLPLGD